MRANSELDNFKNITERLSLLDEQYFLQDNNKLAGRDSYSLALISVGRLDDNPRYRRLIKAIKTEVASQLVIVNARDEPRKR